MIRLFIFFLFFFWGLLEILAFRVLAAYTGLLGCFVEVVVTLLFGMRLLSQQPAVGLQQMQREILAGGDPKKLLIGSLRQYGAGLLLVFPGIISDILGLWLWLTRDKTLSQSRARTTASSGLKQEVGDFDNAWEGDTFNDRLKGKKTASADGEIEDATIIETEESDRNKH